MANTKTTEGVYDGVKFKAARRWFSVASCCVGPGLFRLLFRSSARLLHFHFPWPFGDLLYLFAGRNRPLIVTYHSDIVRQKLLGAVYRPLLERFLDRADRIVATSDNYLETSPVLAKYRDKVEVIPLGISECFYPGSSSKLLIELERKFGKDFFLFIGVLRYYKGLDYLIRAAVGQQFKVLVAGQGPEFERLLALKDALGADNVEFVGYVSECEKACLMSLSRAVVFPSHLRSEAFGVTLVEGLMFGKPLISCEIGTGTSYVNDNGNTGYVVQPRSSDALQEAMIELWGNAELAKNMGCFARQRYEKLFTGERMVESYRRLYSKVLDESGAVS